jgi:hypothetical protein
MLATTRASAWYPLAGILLVLLSVFLTLGYGAIGVCFVLLLAALAGGAIMSWIAPD